MISRGWSAHWGRRLRRGLGLGVIVVLLASVTLTLWVSGCSNRQHFYDVTGELIVPSAAEPYGEALSRAREWKPDAYLFAITAEVASSSGARPAGADLAYYFESPTAGRSYLFLGMIDGQWREEVLAGSTGVTHAEIAREDWVLDSVDAWGIALADGGDEFLIEHQEPLTNMDVELTYRPVGDEDLIVWSVSFSIPFGPRLWLKIDPLSGKILERNSP